MDNGAEGLNGPVGNGAEVRTVLRATRSKGSKVAKAPKAKPDRRPLKLSLSVEVIAKLQLHAMQEGVSVSALVATLAREHLNAWTIHRTPVRGE